MRRWEARIGRRVADDVARLTLKRRLMLAVTLGLTALSAYLLPGLEIETDVSRLLPEANPVTRLNRALLDETHAGKIMIVDLRGEDLEARLPALVERLQASPFLDQVEATRAQFFGSAMDQVTAAPLYYVPEATLAALAERLSPEGRRAAIAQARTRLAEDPVGGKQVVLQDPLDLRTLFADAASEATGGRWKADSDYLVFASGDRAVLRVTGKALAFDTINTRALLEDIRARLDGFEYDLIGEYPRVARDESRIANDLALSATVSFVLVALFLGFTLRRVGDVVAVFVPVLLSLFWTMPIGGALLGALTPLTMSSAAILMGLGVDFSIHYLAKYREARVHADHASAVRITLRSVGRPLLAALLTTALAFLSFLVAEFDGLRVFGWLLALGLSFAFLSCLIVLPTLLSLTSSRRLEPPRSWVVDRVEAFGRRRGGVALAWALPVIGLAGFGLAAVNGVGFTTDSRSLRPYDAPTWVAEREIERALGHGLYPTAVVIPDGTPVDEVRAGFARMNGALAFTSRPDLSSIAPERPARVRALRAELDGWVAGALADLEAAGFHAAPFRPGLEAMAARLDADAPSALGAPLSLETGDAVLVLAFLSEGLHAIDTWNAVAGEFDAAFGPDVRANNLYAVLSEMERVLNRDMFRSGLLTALIGLLVVIPLSGGLRVGILAAAPAFTTLGAVLGFMSLTGLQLNMSNCVGVPFLLGIGVDAGIHLAAHLRRAGRDAKGGSAAVAVWRTSATTALAFGSLCTAEVPGIASLGVLMMIGVTMAFATSTLALPIWWRGSAR